MPGDTTTVLVADVDPAIVARLRSWLADDYLVETTTDGDEAIAGLEDADVALVDRDLRTASGTAVAADIDRDAAHTTAVLRYADPGSERPRFAAETLVKPVSKSSLLETVDRLARRARYDELMAECAVLAVECGGLEAHTNDGRSAEADAEYGTRKRRLAALLVELDELISTFDGNDFRAAFTTCDLAEGVPSQRVERLS